MASATDGGVAVDRIAVTAFRVPTDAPESDGTLQWDATTLVVVEALAGGTVGLGYTYADASGAALISSALRPLVEGSDAFAISRSWTLMVARTRNLGRPGITSAAIAAVDTALWDLKAKLLNLPLVELLGSVRPAVPIYGSGGFTSQAPDQLEDQLRNWVADGITRVKMKVGRNPADDVDRVRLARTAIGKDAQLFVDANGAYDRKQALQFAESYVELGVTWFEEPVSSDDLEGLRLLRDRAPVGMEIAAGEYGYDLVYFRRLLETGAVDVVQADATRCGGITEFLRIGALCSAFKVPLSSHTAPALHCHVCCAVEPLRHAEYFHDHVRIESMLFDGAPVPRNGAIHPDRSRPGMGLVFKHADAAPYCVFGGTAC